MPGAFEKSFGGLGTGVLGRRSVVVRAAPSSDLAPPPERAQFYRVPKTGSTLAWRVLQSFGCTSYNPSIAAHVVMHDHADGCRGQRCNGSATTGERSFVTMRHVCSRFESQFSHMIPLASTIDPWLPVGPAVPQARCRQSQLGNLSTIESFVRSLELWTNKCAGSRGWDGVHCAVRSIDAAFCSKHRVVLYPQAYFMSNETSAVCYSPTHMVARLRVHIQAISRCKTLASEPRYLPYDATQRGSDARARRSLLDGPACQRVQALYPLDHQLWSTYCS